MLINFNFLTLFDMHFYKYQRMTVMCLCTNLYHHHNHLTTSGQSNFNLTTGHIATTHGWLLTMSVDYLLSVLVCCTFCMDLEVMAFPTSLWKMCFMLPLLGSWCTVRQHGKDSAQPLATCALTHFYTVA